VSCPDETTLLAYAQGRLSADETATIEAHVRACVLCPERISTALGAVTAEVESTMALAGGPQVRPRARPDASDAQALPRGASIGRYTVLGLVGRGGMGEVYAAYDPELDRKVALKLLLGASGGDDERARVRLLREAKAIAKLSHANVIVVHDAGTFRERVFIAMEFVDGQTLKDWLAEQPRARREILAVFERAARGLAAAHAAGLVHRDFKPHNVMVGKDGDVRVMDFGLAREINDTSADDALGPEAASGDLTLTRTGELVGTPLYMAPEQFRAQRTDARTDQFSFCVALYQALYGAHPFGGGTFEDLATHVLGGDVLPPPAKHDVPTWLRRVLLRGLALEPAARWPSMAALLEALERDPARARRRWGAIAGVGLLVAAAAVTLVRGPRRDESLCRGGPARLAGVWEPPGAARPRHDALEAAVLRAGGAAGPATWRRVETLLDRYAGAWLGMSRDACEATHARGEQSPETLALRTSCLDERRTALSALSNVLVGADALAVTNAADAVDALPPIERCADVKLLRESVEPPRDEATRARLDDVRARLATAEALAGTGRAEEALAAARGLVAEARALGSRALLAEALGLLGRVDDGGPLRPDAVPSLEESVWTALVVHRDDLVVDGCLALMNDVAGDPRRRAEGRRWARLASALLDRMGPGHELARARLLRAEAGVAAREGDLPEALEQFRRAVPLEERELPLDDAELAKTAAGLAETLHRLGKDDEALATLRRVRGVRLRAGGPAATDLPGLGDQEGESLVALGRAAEAVPILEDAIARWPPSETGESPRVSRPLTDLGQARLALGQALLARAPLEHALRLREAEARDATAIAETKLALARALWDSDDDRARARRLAIEARDGFARGAPNDPAAPRDSIDSIDAWLARHR
jgi:eukaryotic-like serine/threonine-protein kinase